MFFLWIVFFYLFKSNLNRSRVIHSDFIGTNNPNTNKCLLVTIKISPSYTKIKRIPEYCPHLMQFFSAQFILDFPVEANVQSNETNEHAITETLINYLASRKGFCRKYYRYHFHSFGSWSNIYHRKQWNRNSSHCCYTNPYSCHGVLFHLIQSCEGHFPHSQSRLSSGIHIELQLVNC